MAGDMQACVLLTRAAFCEVVESDGLMCPTIRGYHGATVAASSLS